MIIKAKCERMNAGRRYMPGNLSRQISGGVADWTKVVDRAASIVLSLSVIEQTILSCTARAQVCCKMLE